VIHLLYRAIEGRAAELLGVVSNPIDLDTLQRDGDAMPVGGYLVPIAESVTDGEVTACNRDGAFVLAHQFTLAAHEVKQAAKDAAIAGLDSEIRTELFPDFVPEVTRKLARALEREVAVARPAEAVAAKSPEAVKP